LAAGILAPVRGGFVLGSFPAEVLLFISGNPLALDRLSGCISSRTDLLNDPFFSVVWKMKTTDLHFLESCHSNV
jgi:hypothetical protein